MVRTQMKYTTTIKEDESGEYYIDLPDKVVKALNIKVGDEVSISVEKDGGIVIEAKK